MKHLTIMRGLPASLKSTTTRQMVKNYGNAARVNRDDLRNMLYDGAWSVERERTVVAIEKAIVRVLLQSNIHTIVDDCNLTPSHFQLWKEVADENSAVINVHEMKSDLHTLLARDRLRPGKERVGRLVIENMALKAGYTEWSGLPISIFDLDGTLANCSHRQHFVRDGNHDWTGFFEAAVNDTINEGVHQWMRSLYHSGQTEVVIVTGRPDKYSVLVEDWLTRHEVRYHHIFSRRNNDRRDDVLVKKDIVKLMPMENIWFAVDDRPSVIRMWRSLGIKTYDVGEGIDF